VRIKPIHWIYIVLRHQKITVDYGRVRAHLLSGVPKEPHALSLSKPNEATHPMRAIEQHASDGIYRSRGLALFS